MKKLIIYIIAIISYQTASAQDIEPPHRPFRFNGINNYLINSDSAAFRQNRFAWGFIWSGDLRMNNALGFNMWEQRTMYFSTNPLGNFYFPASHYNRNNDLIMQVNRLSWSGAGLYPFITSSFSYCPFLKIETRGEFYTRNGDTTRPVFGFSNIASNIQITSTDMRLRLYHDSSYSNPVLSNPWPNDRLRRLQKIDKDNDQVSVEYVAGVETNITNPYWNGGQFYLVINLRRLDQNDNSQSTDTVLKIKLPYKTTNDSGYIRFDSIPSPVIDSTCSIISSTNHNRGIQRKLIKDQSKSNELIITKNMIPTNSQDITISGFFIMSNIQNNNPILKYLGNDTFSVHVKEIGIEVSYYGGANSCDVGIREIRIETPLARDLKFGRCDNVHVKIIP